MNDYKLGIIKIYSCDRLATCPGCTRLLPCDIWDWLQPHHDPESDKKAGGWMDGWIEK